MGLTMQFRQTRRLEARAVYIVDTRVGADASSGEKCPLDEQEDVLRDDIALLHCIGPAESA